MRVGSSNSPDRGKGWAQLYLAAIFECDQTVAVLRIFEAEQAVVLRAHELFDASGDNLEEQEDLEDAMYALHALRSPLTYGRDRQRCRTNGLFEMTSGEQLR
jgi:hypothetical protein